MLVASMGSGRAAMHPRHGAAGLVDRPRSEFGGKVAVDFETYADFDQSWSRPSHCASLLSEQ
jgi:hypothetical protein